MNRELKKIIKKIIRIALTPLILLDFYKFKASGENKRFLPKIKNFNPQLFDKTIRTGYDKHYIYHTAWAARKLAETKPQVHIDISSSLYFVGVVSAFIPIKFYDYRPPALKLRNLETSKEDLTKLSFPDSSIKSLSCMHTVEHIGLGRYGDRFDPDGDLKAIAELKRVLAEEGNLFFVVPLGKPKIEFNAHRIYSLEMIKEYFQDLKLKEFVLIPENNSSPIIDATSERVAEEDYGCGCFWFTK